MEEKFLFGSFATALRFLTILSIFFSVILAKSGLVANCFAISVFRNDNVFFVFLSCSSIKHLYLILIAFLSSFNASYNSDARPLMQTASFKVMDTFKDLCTCLRDFSFVEFITRSMFSNVLTCSKPLSNA